MAILIFDQIDFKTKLLPEKRRDFFNDKGSIRQENMTQGQKYLNLTELKEK